VLALLCTACTKHGGFLDHAIGGTVAVAQSDGRCDGAGVAVSEGTRVTLTDSGGKVLGTAHLGAAHPDGHRCVYLFSFTGIPSSDRYSVSVAGHTSSYTLSELQLKNWFVNLRG
jgi:hypothetical protein